MIRCTSLKRWSINYPKVYVQSANKEGTGNKDSNRETQFHIKKDDVETDMFSLKMAKLEFPRFSGDVSLSKIRQMGSLRDYQKEFERLGNRLPRVEPGMVKQIVWQKTTTKTPILSGTPPVAMTKSPTSVKPTKPYSVKVANGGSLTCQGRFENIPILLQCIPFFLSFYSLPLYGLDLVLSVQWLELLGTVTCNWKQLTLEFTWDNRSHRLHGIDRHTAHHASIKSISKYLRSRNVVFVVYLDSPDASLQ